ncbi:RING/U-box superfamily protein [Abeliophyllum distichum]|uniref:RING/U-box superfamily protein n=1 Tax=Abeliophyllum distichum TaxID=126358 RepID=A0ABD1UPN3_9LAMI
MKLQCRIGVKHSQETVMHNESHSKFVLLVEFRSQTVERGLVYDDDGQFRVLIENPEPEIFNVASLDFAKPYIELKQLMLAELANYHIPREECEEKIADKLYDFAQRMLSKCKDFSIVVTIKQFFDYIVDPSDMHNNGPHMVPTSTEAIMLLSRKRMEYESDDSEFESCTVCLEEMVEGSMVATLTCSHIFHDDCISEWLKRSHYCPNCRFEMPTALNL